MTVPEDPPAIAGRQYGPSASLERAQLEQVVTGRAAVIDRLRTILKGLVGAIPVVGSGATAVFELAWVSEFERRTKTLLGMVLHELLTFEERVTELEAVATRLRDPGVTSVGLTAVSMAGRANGDDKLRYLAVCVARVAAGEEPWATDIDFSLVLLRLVDDLTVTQIAFLEFLANPTRWEREHGRSIRAVRAGLDGRIDTRDLVAEAFPAYRSKSVVLNALLAGIEARGLFSAIGLAEDGSGFLSPDQIREGSASDLGSALLRFLRLAD